MFSDILNSFHFAFKMEEMNGTTKINMVDTRSN